MDTIIIDGLSFALPLFIMAVGGIYSEKSGITNLALEGLQGVGAFFGALMAVIVANYVSADSKLPFYVALLAAALGGLLYSLLHALLCIRLKANQVISGIVINILAIALTSFLTKEINKEIFHTPSEKFQLGVSARFTIAGLSEIPVIGAIFKNIYPFEIIIIVIAIIAWYLLYKTRYGMHLRACGENPHAVDAAGVEVGKVRLIAVMLSGSLSGLAGMCFAYSISASFSSSIYAGYGYLAIAAMIFGNWKMVPTLFACLLFGLARAGGFQLVRIFNMPGSYSDLAMILPYALTIILLIFFSGHNAAPKALGEIYEKGKR